MDYQSIPIPPAPCQYTFQYLTWDVRLLRLAYRAASDPTLDPLTHEIMCSFLDRLTHWSADKGDFRVVVKSIGESLEAIKQQYDYKAFGVIGLISALLHRAFGQFTFAPNQWSKYTLVAAHSPLYCDGHRIYSRASVEFYCLSAESAYDQLLTAYLEAPADGPLHWSIGCLLGPEHDPHQPAQKSGELTSDFLAFAGDLIPRDERQEALTHMHFRW